MRSSPRPSAWSILRIVAALDLEPQTKRLEIQLDVRRGSTFACAKCGPVAARPMTPRNAAGVIATSSSAPSR
jgi:hypothetical protein